MFPQGRIPRDITLLMPAQQLESDDE